MHITLTSYEPFLMSVRDPGRMALEMLVDPEMSPAFHERAANVFGQVTYAPYKHRPELELATCRFTVDSAKRLLDSATDAQIFLPIVRFEAGPGQRADVPVRRMLGLRYWKAIDGDSDADQDDSRASLVCSLFVQVAEPERFWRLCIDMPW